MLLSMADIGIPRGRTLGKGLFDLRAGIQEIQIVDQPGFGCLGALSKQGARPEHGGKDLSDQALAFRARLRVRISVTLEFDNLLNGIALASKQIDHLGSSWILSRARVVSAQRANLLGEF